MLILIQNERTKQRSTLLHMTLLILLPTLALSGSCANGWYVPSAQTSACTNMQPQSMVVGGQWETYIDPLNNQIIGFKSNVNEAGYIMTYTSATDTNLVFTYTGSARIDTTSSAFNMEESRYNTNDVTTSGGTVTFSNNGAFYGASLSLYSTFQTFSVNIDAVSNSLCFGIFEGTTYDVNDDTATNKQLFCVGSTNNALSLQCGSCLQCDSSCSLCTGGTNYDCSSCRSGFYLQPTATACLNTCPAGYYPYSAASICSPCDTSCATCTGSSNTVCQSCKSGYYLQPPSTPNTCLNSCPAGYYPDTGNNICPPCDTSCATCTGSSNTVCQSCKAGFYLQPPSTPNTCLNTCPAGYYPNTDVCSPCDISCATCTGSSNTVCQSCKAGHYLQPPSTPNTCLNSCPAIGYYPDPNHHTCPDCQPTCYTCNWGGADNCSSCTGSLFWYQSRCRECPSIGYYPRITDNACAQCDNSCSGCNSNTNTSCLSCPSGSYLFGSSCYSTCPNGYYPNSDNYICTKCYTSCKTCTAGTPTSCITCNTSFNLLATTQECVTECPDGFWTDSLNQACKACNSTCATCPDSVNCTKCNSSTAFIDNQVCYVSCPNGKYRDVHHMTCNPCPDGCSLCYSPVICLRCASGYSFYTDPTTEDMTCLVTCPITYYSSFVNNSQAYVCQSCDSSCFQCNGSNSNQCTTCQGDYILSEGSCFANNLNFSCPNGTYLDSLLCLPCPKGCASCSEVTRCSTCLGGFTLGITTGLCELPQALCHPKCKTCSGTTEFDCTSCTIPLLFEANTCVVNCGTGFKYNAKTENCGLCFEGCSSCVPEMIYYGGNCVFSCPDGMAEVIDENGQISCNLKNDSSLISFVQRPSQNNTVGLNQDLVIQVSVTYPSSNGSGSQTLTINWTQTDIYAVVTKILQGIAILNSTTLIIPRNNLVSNTYYQLNVAASINGDTYNSISTSFTTAKSIIGGTFNFTPTTGNFFDTVFNLTIDGWTPNFVNGVFVLFSVIASRNDNPNNKVVIANLLNLFDPSSSSFDGYQFTIPSLFEEQNEQNVVYTIELIAESFSDTLSVFKTTTLNSLSCDRITQLIMNTDATNITSPVAMSNFVILAVQNLILNSSLETQATSTMKAAFQMYQTLTGDFSVVCLASIHCSGQGTCISSTVAPSSTDPTCNCNSGWGGRSCNKDAHQLQQAQKVLGVVLTNLLTPSPTIENLGSLILAVQVVAREPDLIVNDSQIPSLMTKTVVEGYKIFCAAASSSSSSSTSNTLLSTIADTAFALPYQLSDFLSDNDLLDELSLVFSSCLHDLLASLNIGDFNLIDSPALYLFLTSAEDFFEEIFDNGDDIEADRRILQESPHIQRQTMMISSTTYTSLSITDDDKQSAALQNQIATQPPTQKSTTIDAANLIQILKALLSKLKIGRTIQLKTASQDYNTDQGSFRIPKLVLTVKSSLTFTLQETKAGANNQASNSNTLVTKSVTFTANDGTTPIPINSLQTPIRIAIPKITPTTPSPNESNTYQCSYYDETSRRFLTNGCSFIGENLTHIICQCSHATEFAANVNEATLNSFDNFFNKPSLQELIELSIHTSPLKKNNTFNIALQKDILSKVHTIILDYKSAKFNFWPIGVSVIILVMLIVLYPLFNFFESTKREYFASWSDESFLQEVALDGKGCTRCGSAIIFWSLYSLISSNCEKYLTKCSIRTLSFYTEVINLMGNVMAWVIFLSSPTGVNLMPQEKTAILSYTFVIGMSFASALVSFHVTLGLINRHRISLLQKHYLRIEKKEMSSTDLHNCWELVYIIVCILTILTWLALFAAFSIILLNSEVTYWLICCLGAAIFSYVVMDTLMVIVYLIFRPKKMLLMLAMRALNSEYLALSLHSHFIKDTI